MTSSFQAAYGSPTTMACTLASLASSTVSPTIGRQTTLVDNSVTRYDLIHIFGKITTCTTAAPTAGSIFVYPIKADAATPTLATANAGASDAAISVPPCVSALAVIPVTTATTGNTYYFDCVFADPGPAWGLAFTHNSVQILHQTASNHSIEYVGQYWQGN